MTRTIDMHGLVAMLFVLAHRSRVVALSRARGVALSPEAADDCATAARVDFAARITEARC